MRHPNLTVVIPAFNSECTIANAVSSATSITDRVIVVDDGSGDNTAEIAEALGAHVIRQSNSGAYAARQAGAKCVDTAFVAFLDADDELIGSGVRRSIDQLQADCDLGVVAGRVIGVDHRGRRAPVPRGYSVADPASLALHGYSPWPPAAQVIRTSAYTDQLAMSLPALAPRYAEDYELLFRLSIISRVACHTTASCLYRIDGGKSALNSLRVVECKERIRNYYGAYYSLDWDPLTRRQKRAAANARAAHAAVKRGDFGEACFRAANVALANPKIIVSALRRRLPTR